MLVGQSGFFKKISQSAIDILTAHGSEKVGGVGDLVFCEGDTADYFYIITEGTVNLVMGEDEQLCFSINQPGDIFGWSALFEPYRYRASARCATLVRFIAIPRVAVEKMCETYPADGTIFFRNLASIITDKLQEVYRNVVSEVDPWR